MKDTWAARARRPLWLGVPLALWTLVACSRPQLENPCPEAVAGELVLTEFRGSQSGSDTYGEWIELYNASDHSISLGGLQVRALDLDGGSETLFTVRDAQLELPMGAYAVLGSVDRDPMPAHLDYSFGADGVSGLRSGAIVTLEACGEVVDQTLYRSLPDVGSWSLDGSMTPTAELNDDEDLWCTDDVEPEPGDAVTELGVPGTPGEPNRECGS